MKYKKYLAAAVTAGLLINPLTISWAQQLKTGAADNYVEQNVYDEKSSVMGTTKIQKISVDNTSGLVLSDDNYILDSKVADVNNDNIEDNVYLVGHKQNKEALFADQLKVAVEDGKTKAVRFGNVNVAGYEAKLFIGDFSGDGVNDIMVTAPTGGSGGMTEHVIASFDGDNIKIIFGAKENQGIKLTGKFVNGFQAELTAENVSKKVTVDNSTNKENYTRMGIYSADGTLLKEQKPYSYPFGVLEPVDIDGDGVYELKGHQRIVGAYNADSLAEAETILKYQDGQWMIKQIKIASYVLKDTKKPLVATGYNIARHSIKTDSAEIYYPQVENMQGMLTMGYINQDLQNAAKKYLAKANPNAKVFIDYEVMRQDNDMISVFFKGRQQMEGGEYKILTSVNEDIKSRNQIFAQNLIKSDEQSHRAMTELLHAAGSNNANIKTIPQFGDWMGIYFTNTDLVFYYRENDFSQDYTQIAVPLEKARQYFNEQIKSVNGMEPAS